MTNTCKNCNTELICVGYFKEAPDYQEWKCSKCDKEKNGQ